MSSNRIHIKLIFTAVFLLILWLCLGVVTNMDFRKEISRKKGENKLCS